MARLYADEMFPRQVSELLRTMGHDVLTVQSAVDTLLPKGEEILGSTSPLKLNPLRYLAGEVVLSRQLLQVGKAAQRTGSSSVDFPSAPR